MHLDKQTVGKMLTFLKFPEVTNMKLFKILIITQYRSKEKRRYY